MIRSSEDMMEVLHIVRSLCLPDWWVGAGFVRNRVWDALHGYEEPTPWNDIDVIYYDTANAAREANRALEETLAARRGYYPWSVSNQARMHLLASDAPYTSRRDAVGKWPETCTAIAVTLDSDGDLQLFAPHGVDDLLGLKVVPAPHFYTKRGAYEKRMIEKNWRSLWPGLEIYHFD